MAPKSNEFQQPTIATLLWRGLTLRCAACGSGNVVRRWFHLAERCPRCHLRFEREPGMFVGAVGMNTIVTFVLLLAVLLVGVVATYPDLREGPLLVACVATAALVPVAFYPASKTLWLAISIAMTPLEPGEADPPWAPAAD